MQIQGLTLLEVLIVLSLVAILTVVATPNLQSWFAQNRLNQTAQQIMTAIDFARSSAIQENASVMYCGSSDHQQCDGNWKAGQILLSIQENKVLRTWPALAKKDELVWTSSLGRDTGLTFTADGFTYGQEGNFSLCATDVPVSMVLIVTFSGRVRVETRSGSCG